MHLLGVALRGRYRGQTAALVRAALPRQRRRYPAGRRPAPEFDAWRWAELAELPALAVDFKRAIYRDLSRPRSPGSRGRGV